MDKNQDGHISQAGGKDQGISEKHKEVDKEIIRRLRIQNKKLLEQVIKLKKEVKEAKLKRNQVFNHISKLLELIN